MNIQVKNPPAGIPVVPVGKPPPAALLAQGYIQIPPGSGNWGPPGNLFRSKPNAMPPPGLGPPPKQNSAESEAEHAL